MTAFRSPVDIGNRALQHCGTSRMDPTVGFNEDSKNASEVSFCYDMMREAELQRRYWSFAIKRTVLRPIDSNTMLLDPALWVASTTYFVGSIVADEAGSIWISNTPSNVGSDPLNTLAWEPYCGPLAVPLFDTTGNTAYSTGELVYTTPGDGTALVYFSLQDSNSDVPATATAWSATAVYSKDDVVTYSSVAYKSLINLNTNQTPSSAPTLWSATTTYASGNKVGGSDGVIYQSIGSGNIGNDPTIDLTGTFWTNTGVLNPWTTSFVGGSGSVKWRLIGGTAFPSGVGVKKLSPNYPVGAGPVSQSWTRNTFLLPANYLRLASQIPKAGIGALGGPTGVTYSDWLIESGYLTTMRNGAIAFRFVANITDVNKMHTMFCEGLAARIAVAIADAVTQSNVELATIERIYDRSIKEAGAVDAIEEGFKDSPDDDFITVRL